MALTRKAFPSGRKAHLVCIASTLGVVTVVIVIPLALMGSLDQTFTLWNWPLQVSQGLLGTLGTQVSVRFSERIPLNDTLLVISNHRSFLDAPVLISGLGRAISFACHPYMGQVPLMREIVQGLGGFPLDAYGKSGQSLLRQADSLLHNKAWVGIFPEGGEPMIHPPCPERLGPFYRGFAHLALRSQIPNLTILPVAIASQNEIYTQTVPLQLLSWFDPSEPLFQNPGRHPAVFYREVDLRVGQPLQITSQQQQAYQGKGAKTVAAELTQRCQAEIAALLKPSKC
jgi:1-acyl-sn-glycerol-3-phosphate acyltransferase